MKTPVQKLPVELLNSIFQYCLPQKFGSDSALLILAQVCQQWRQVALESHELWAKLYIDNHAVRRRNTLDLLDIWLKRSGRRLIDVNIDFSLSGDNTKTFILEHYHEKQMVYRKLLSVLYRRSSRTRSFQGILPPSVASEYPIHKMKLLEVLDLTGESECSSSSLPSLDLSTQIPTLRRLSLQGVGLHLRSLHSQTQLTRLELSGCNVSGLGPHTAVDLLNALSNLQVVYLALDRSDDPEHRPTFDQLRLPALRHLYISWNWADTGNVRYLLGQFYAPHLERLALKGTLQEMIGIWDALLLFILASDTPSLTHLAIGDIGATDVSLLDVLRVTPSLTHLTVNHALVHPHLLRALVWDVHKPEAQLVPRLTSLRFGACEDFEASDILPVLQSRSGTSIASLEGVSCLEEVDLRQCSGLRREDEKYILATGIRKIALDTEETLLSPFGGLFHFLRFEESHHDFFVD